MCQLQMFRAQDVYTGLTGKWRAAISVHMRSPPSASRLVVPAPSSSTPCLTCQVTGPFQDARMRALHSWSQATIKHYNPCASSKLAHVDRQSRMEPNL